VRQTLAALLARFGPHLRGTTRAGAPRDVAAALAVAALGVPQAVGYALVAGLPIEMGLAAAGLPAVVGSLFGSSRFMITGPTNPTALLLGASVVAPAVASGEDPVAAALATGLFAGAVLMALGAAGFGRASRFLSDSVVVGFNVGVGLLIALRYAPLAAGAESARDLLSHVDLRAVVVGGGVLVLALALRRADPRLPGPLVALAAVTVAAWTLGWLDGPDALVRLEPFSLGAPAWRLPAVGDPATLASPALALALLITVQSLASARALEPARGPALDPDRELFSQGAANLTAALVGAQCTSGSLTRSVTARLAGAHSRLAGVAAGLVLFLGLPLLAPLLAPVPLAAIAGLIVLSGLAAISPTQIRRAGATPGDALVLAVTVAVTLLLDLVDAVYAGLLLSLALLVRRAGRLQMQELAQGGGRRLRELALDARTGASPAVVLNLEGDLSFAVAPELADRLQEIAARGPEVLVLRLKRARHLDATVLEVLRRVAAELAARGGALILCGLAPGLRDAIARTELGALVGPDGLVPAGSRLLEGLESVLDAVRARLRPRSDAEIFRLETGGEPDYEI
jgi:SulP family sulfate permease